MRTLHKGDELAPQKLTTDFLKCVRQHAETVLKENVPPSALKSTPIDHVVIPEFRCYVRCSSYYRRKRSMVKER